MYMFCDKTLIYGNPPGLEPATPSAELAGFPHVDEVTALRAWYAGLAMRPTCLENITVKPSHHFHRTMGLSAGTWIGRIIVHRSASSARLWQEPVMARPQPKPCD
jgi:hypothetical protein